MATADLNGNSLGGEKEERQRETKRCRVSDRKKKKGERERERERWSFERRKKEKSVTEIKGMAEIERRQRKRKRKREKKRKRKREKKESHKGRERKWIKNYLFFSIFNRYHSKDGTILFMCAKIIHVCLWLESFVRLFRVSYSIKPCDSLKNPLHGFVNKEFVNEVKVMTWLNLLVSTYSPREI